MSIILRVHRYYFNIFILLILYSRCNAQFATSVASSSAGGATAFVPQFGNNNFAFNPYMNFPNPAAGFGMNINGNRFPGGRFINGNFPRSNQNWPYNNNMYYNNQNYYNNNPYNTNQNNNNWNPHRGGDGGGGAQNPNRPIFPPHHSHHFGPHNHRHNQNMWPPNENNAELMPTPTLMPNVDDTHSDLILEPTTPKTINTPTIKTYEIIYPDSLLYINRNNDENIVSQQITEQIDPRR